MSLAAHGQRWPPPSSQCIAGLLVTAFNLRRRLCWPACPDNQQQPPRPTLSKAAAPPLLPCPRERNDGLYRCGRWLDGLSFFLSFNTPKSLVTSSSNILSIESTFLNETHLIYYTPASLPNSLPNADTHIPYRRVITYLVAKMVEELGVALINSIVFCEPPLLSL